MAGKKSAVKRARKSEEQRARNRAVKSRLKTLVKQLEAAVATKDEQKINAALAQAFSAVDKASAQGVIHKNTAARKKSALAKMTAAASGQQSAPTQ